MNSRRNERRKRLHLMKMMQRNERIMDPHQDFKLNLVEPPYIAQETESWALAKGGPKEARGWYSGITPCPEKIWILQRDDTVWMSNSPLEVESQYLPIVAAKGTVVIGGLGMGWVAWNIASKPDVEKTIVIELDDELADAFPQMVGLESEDDLPFEIFRGNALETTTEDLGVERVDLLYMDIWPSIADDRALEDTRAAYANIPADKVFWWTQEVAIADYAGEKRGTDSGNPYVRATKLDVREYIEHSELPLAGPELHRYFHILVERARYHHYLTAIELHAGVVLEEDGYPRLITDTDGKIITDPRRD